jgi:hypothetical protein
MHYSPADNGMHLLGQKLLAMPKNQVAAAAICLQTMAGVHLAGKKLLELRNNHITAAAAAIRL